MYPGLSLVVPNGQEMVAAAVDMEVVSAVSGFLPAAVHDDSRVRLVRTLVLGETHDPMIL